MIKSGICFRFFCITVNCTSIKYTFLGVLLLYVHWLYQGFYYEYTNIGTHHELSPKSSAPMKGYKILSNSENNSSSMMIRIYEDSLATELSFFFLPQTKERWLNLGTSMEINNNMEKKTFRSSRE